MLIHSEGMSLAETSRDARRLFLSLDEDEVEEDLSLLCDEEREG